MKCRTCGEEHCGEAASNSGEFLDEGFCSAECFYIEWMKNPRKETFTTFSWAKNFDEAFECYERL
jgi:hypothetical protein